MSDSPPAGTAIARPARHVMAVRERHLEQLAGTVPDGSSPSARAWEWALGETDIAPVTGRVTCVPPGRAEIEAEIAEADERRLRGDRKGRADGAAAVLRWLIGDDDRLPVRGPDRGELVGGFGEVVRSPADITELIAGLTRLSVREGEASGAEYRRGVIATAKWILDRQVTAPVSGVRTDRLTGRDLKTERLHAADMREQRVNLARAGTRQSGEYALGVIRAIDWLLGGRATFTMW
jgi:hypothetical protein